MNNLKTKEYPVHQLKSELEDILASRPNLYDWQSDPKAIEIQQESSPVRLRKAESRKPRLMRLVTAIGATTMAAIVALGVGGNNEVRASSPAKAATAVAAPARVKQPTAMSIEHKQFANEVISAIPSESKQLFEQQLPAIKDLEGTYRATEAETGVPWQLLAAIHYREATNNSAQSIFAGEQLGSVNRDHNKVMGTTLSENFRLGAEHFKAAAQAVYGIDVTKPNLTIDELTKATVAYNRWGMYTNAGQSAHDSPYAVNGLSPDNIGMTWPDTAAEPLSTRGDQDAKLGAVPFAILAGYPVAA